jgi:hypothetical protein
MKIVSGEYKNRNRGGGLCSHAEGATQTIEASHGERKTNVTRRSKPLEAACSSEVIQVAPEIDQRVGR